VSRDSDLFFINPEIFGLLSILPEISALENSQLHAYSTPAVAPPHGIRTGKFIEQQW